MHCSRINALQRNLLCGNVSQRSMDVIIHNSWDQRIMMMINHIKIILGS